MASPIPTPSNDFLTLPVDNQPKSPDGLLSDHDPGDSPGDSGSDGANGSNAMLQEHFLGEMQALAQRRGHAKVAVLLLQWEPEHEGYLDTRQEVESLRRVFKDEYRFSVRTEFLNTSRRADHQLSYHLSKFVLDEDHDHALLIVYYAGHGWAEADQPGKLYLHGGNSKTGQKEQLSRILWEEVEQSLERAEADLLIIFDCCYAGLLAQDDPRAANPKRIFEFLGATPGGKTARGPGDYSFTNALIWALKELSKESDWFTISQLWTVIRKAPNFCETNQEPVYSPRGKSTSLYKLQIRPLLEQGSFPQTHRLSNVKPAENPTSVFLHLSFAFDKPLTKKHISVLCHSLKDVVKRDDLPLKQVRWKGLSDEDVRPRFSDIVKKVLTQSHRRRLSSLASPPGPDKHPPQIVDKEGLGLEAGQPSMAGSELSKPMSNVDEIKFHYVDGTEKSIFVNATQSIQMGGWKGSHATMGGCAALFFVLLFTSLAGLWV